MIANGCDPKSVAGVLVDPIHLQPFSRIDLVWSDEMKLLRVSSWRMPQLVYVASDQEIEGFDVLSILFPSVEVRQRLHNCWTAD